MTAQHPNTIENAIVILQGDGGVMRNQVINEGANVHVIQWGPDITGILNELRGRVRMPIPMPTPPPAAEKPTRKVTDIEKTLSQREAEYGDFCDVASAYRELSRQLQSGMADITGLDVEVAALDMIAMKLARISNGKRRQTDSWRDIAGYALLVVRQMEEEAAE